MLLTAYELIAALPYTNRLYTTYETGLILEGWDIEDYQIELERALTTYEIDSLEYARSHSNISDNYYLLEKYTPNVLSGHPAYSHIIFHAACLSCTSQKEHGIDRCRGCTSFKFDMDKPCLKIN